MANYSANEQYNKLQKQKSALQHALTKAPERQQYGILGKIKQIDVELSKLKTQINNFEFLAR